MNWRWLFIIYFYSTVLIGEELKWLEAAKQTAVIVIKSEIIKKPNQVQSNLWRTICDSLGNNLKQSKAGVGFISTFQCEFGKSLADLEKKYNWIIYIHETEAFLAIDIYSQIEGKTALVQKFSFTSKENQLEIYGRPKVLENLARLIVESLPLGWSSIYQGASKNFVFQSADHLPPLPSRLLVYRLAYDSQADLWLPQPRAELEFLRTEAAGPGMKYDIFKHKTIWLPLVQGETYWVQNSAGLNMQQELHEKRLAKDLTGFSVLNIIDRLFLESLSSNYSGLRYGQSFLKGKSVITETSLLSVLVEMRSGPLSGLRWYFDYMPKVKATSEFGQEHFAMKRLLLGWSFDFKTPKPFSKYVSRVDLQPKLGLLDVNGQFLVSDFSGTISPFEIKAKNVANLSLELGIESESWFTRNRLWASYSSAKLALKNRAGLGVSSSRIGLDAYVDFASGQRLKWSVMAFGMAENMQLTRDRNALQRNSDVAISEISFNLFFLGGGISLAW